MSSATCTTEGAALRVVFDTNILVSALVFPGGRGEAALRRIAEEQNQLVLSKPILGELLGILGRKFSRDAEELAHVAVFLSDLAHFVKPRSRLHVVKDEPDNRILECALAGRAGAIITGDRALLTLGEYRGVRIISLREYLDRA
ncbi:MAG: putative toxin-antitoxin system toxin component, PIN family [Burkholderiales bacterium]